MEHHIKVYIKVNKKVFLLILLVCSLICIWCTSELVSIYHKTTHYQKVQATVSNVYYKDSNTHFESESSLGRFYEVRYIVKDKPYQRERACYVLYPTRNSEMTVYVNPNDPVELRPSLEPYYLVITVSALFALFSLLCFFFLN